MTVLSILQQSGGPYIILHLYYKDMACTLPLLSFNGMVLKDFTRVSEDDQREIFPSDPFTATSGRHPETPVEASTPFRTESTEPHLQKNARNLAQTSSPLATMTTLVRQEEETSTQTFTTTSRDLLSGHHRNEQTEEYPPEDRVQVLLPFCPTPQMAG